MLRAIWNKSWRQHPTRHQLYGHLPPITKTTQVRRTRHAWYCWRSRDKLISDVLLWSPTYGRAKAGRPARTYIQQLYEDTGCSQEDLPEAMNDGEKWRERFRDIRASGTTWWWWWHLVMKEGKKMGINWWMWWMALNKPDYIQYFFIHASCWMWPCVILRSTTFLLLTSMGHFSNKIFVAMLTKERHGEHKRFDRKTYIFK